MIEIKMDETVILGMIKEAINKKVKEVETDLVYWDTKELKRRTCMSWNTIQDSFFHDHRFPKVKVGGKWYYPAKECEQFLINWLNEKRLNNV
ncbi:group-specific protein [Ureibacillus composti]